MAKIDIISGFLGAGKTTLIKKLVADAFQGEKLVIIENEFGEIGIDGGFLKESGIQITEMNSGCICCSLVGDFGNALKDVLEKYSPDRVIIEPSGVGKLSDVIKAVKNIGDDVKINSTATVVDASKCKMYMKNYGEFYNNQIESAGTIILSRTQNVSEEKLAKVLTMIKEKNDEASVITTPWDQIDGKKILDAMEKVNTLEKELLEEHHHHDGECGCGHEHHHHDGSCSCGHDHDADEVFISWGAETPRKYTEEEISGALHALGEEANYGVVLRAKGIVPCQDGTWIHFDYVPGEQNIRRGPAGFTGRLCVIGSELKEHALEHLFCLH